jgi:2-phosphosulfolactate phosphatase
MHWHIIEGEEGCDYAVRHGCVAVVVDALRASATAAMLLHAGATELLVVRDVREALAAKAQTPDALLYGERGGLRPEGFDYGNSPREAVHARGRRVIFTTTTGAGRLLSAWGAGLVCMGTSVNAAAVARVAAARDQDVVLIPAGLAGDPAFDAQEDRAAAVAIALAAEAPIGEGREVFEFWRSRIETEGLPALFAAAPHAAKLRRAGLGADIPYCARLNLTPAVPVAAACTALGVVVRNGGYSA